MEMGGLMGFIYRAAEWIMRLAYVNFLWLLFTIMGLIVFGLFPSTVGVFTVARQWIKRDTEIPVWHTYWQAYKKEFVKANIVGYVFAVIGYIVYLDMKFFQLQGGMLFVILSYAFLIVFIIYMVMALFLFPVYVHYELKTLQYLKQTFFIVMLRPLDVLFAVAGFIAVYYLMLFVQVLMLFFGMSVMAVVLMWIAYRSFHKLEIKIEKQKAKD